MPSDRRGLRGVALVEDRRTERFCRTLLEELGFDVHPKKLRFQVAPRGKGAAEAGIRKRYPNEVRAIRSKAHQRNLYLIAVRDGDLEGVAARKRQMDDALRAEDLDPRRPKERIATPVPTWSIESWLLDLLGEDGIDEGRSAPAGTTWKQVFERRHDGKAERAALRDAAKAWLAGVGTREELPSLTDGRAELARLDP